MGNSQVKTQDPRTQHQRVQASRSLQEALTPRTMPPTPPHTNAAADDDDDDDDDESDEEVEVERPPIVQRKWKQPAAALAASPAAAPRAFKSQPPVLQPQPLPRPPMVGAPAIPIPVAPAAAEVAVSPASSSLPHESPNLHLAPPIEPPPFASHSAAASARLPPAATSLSHSQPTPTRRLHNQLKTQHPHRLPFSLEHKSFRRGFVRASPIAAAPAAQASAGKPTEEDEHKVVMTASTKTDQGGSVIVYLNLNSSQSSDDASVLSPAASAAAAAPDTHDPSEFSEAQNTRREAVYDEATRAAAIQSHVHDHSLQYIPASEARTLKELLQYSVFNGLMRESEAFHSAQHARMRQERAQTMENRPQPNLDQKLRRNPLAPADPDEGEAEYLAPAEIQKQAPHTQPIQHATLARSAPARAQTYEISQTQDSDETYAPTPQQPPRRRKHRNEQPRSRQLAEAFASGHD